jgi:hypothetical protein
VVCGGYWFIILVVAIVDLHHRPVPVIVPSFSLLLRTRLLDLTSWKWKQVNRTGVNQTAADGARLVIVPSLNEGWRFGGYMCVQSGASIGRDVSCYLQEMWRLDLSNMSWTLFPLPDSPAQLALVPSNRAYHSMTYYSTTNRIYIVGGTALQRPDVVMFEWWEGCSARVQVYFCV